MIRGFFLLGVMFLSACSAPLEPSGPDQLWAQISMGDGHTCLLDDQGRIGCFGANSRGQLGVGRGEQPTAPVLLPVGSGFTDVAAGAYHTCAIGPAGGVWCWGANDMGQLGLGDRADRDLPVRLDLPGRFLNVSGGLAHTCATRVDGVALCWGSNSHGQLGIGLSEPGPFGPTVVEGGWASVAAGQSHSCGQDRTGTPACWGWNEWAQLGTGTRVSTVVPSRVASPEPLLGPAAADTYSCALDPRARLLCWGGGVAGFPIAGEGPAVGAPIQWDDRAVRAFTVFPSGVCAVLVEGSMVCRGPGAGRQGLDAWASGVKDASDVGGGLGQVCVIVGPGRLDCF